MPPRAFLPPRRGQVFTPLRVLRVAPLLARPFLAHFKLTAAQPALCGATHSAGYKASFAQGVTEAGCLAHARRKYFDLHAANNSQIAEFALQQFARVYEIEREVQALPAPERLQVRQQHSRPILDALHQWMVLQRQQVAGNSATAKALDYSLKRWTALTRFVDDPQLPADNNWIENRIRPIALGRSNWLFAGSLRAGQRAAAVMSLIQSARMNGHDPYAYLKDVLTRLPTHRASRIEELLPHHWVPR